jgi:hypothetical protein
MRKTKMLAILLMLGMALNVLAGCAGGASEPTTEEPTTTTTAVPTTDPTPTPEPTPTPAPTPPVEKWATDERLSDKTWFRIKDSMGFKISYVFNHDNTGFIISWMNTVDKQGEDYITTFVRHFKYSVIDEGKIRIVYNENMEYEDLKYVFSKDLLQLIPSDSNADDPTTLYMRKAPWR